MSEELGAVGGSIEDRFTGDVRETTFQVTRFARAGAQWVQLTSRSRGEDQYVQLPLAALLAVVTGEGTPDEWDDRLRQGPSAVRAPWAGRRG